MVPLTKVPRWEEGEEWEEEESVVCPLRASSRMAVGSISLQSAVSIGRYQRPDAVDGPGMRQIPEQLATQLAIANASIAPADRSR